MKLSGCLILTCSLIGAGFASTADAALVLGLDAHDIGLADGAAVNSWTGGVGSAAQATAIFQPTYRAASTNLNGMPAVDFNYSTTPVVDGQGMTTSVSGLGTDYSILSLYAYRGDPGFARVVNGGNGTRHAAGAAAANNWLMGPYNGLHQLYDGAFINSGSTVTTPVISTALGSAAANNQFFLNGGLIGSNANNNAPNFVGLGSEGAFAETANSDIGLVLVFDTRLTDDERIGVEYYMAQAYGLSGFSANSSQQAAGAAQLNGFLVPEPGSVSLLLFGGVLFLLRRRR